MPKYDHRKIEKKRPRFAKATRGKQAGSYSPRRIEKKWQKIWEDKGFYKARDFDKRPKKYVMVEFPYPSGDGLHVGHVRSYAALDAVARKKRMDGHNVLYPIGWDAFGLPTENYAIKKGVHPSIVTKRNVAVFKRQLKSLGLSFDWSREINTTDPGYYKWTQWIFLKFFEKSLAYQAEMPINWCPSCKIGLANEEVIDGRCERCGTQTERRNIKQWMLKITAYADRLIDDLEKVDYLEKIKAQQINWIGRSEGMDADFRIAGSDKKITVFTTRIDTLFGVTALVLAPEHPLAGELTIAGNREKVKGYIEAAGKKSELERTEEKEKTGVFTGSYCLNPASGEKIPVWVGDYVVASYGGGAVMMVPAHDQRDFEFAQKYDLPVKTVVCPEYPAPALPVLEKAYVEDGYLVDSGDFTGLPSAKARAEITARLKNKGLGKLTVQYKLRDWIFSRQHYWGEPIPLVFCENCATRINAEKTRINADISVDQRNHQRQSAFSEGEMLNPGWVAISEKDLPVKLPYVKKYQPTATGESPLAGIKNWVNARCPKCGGPARRETDTMPNWAGSSWYFLRYVDPKNKKTFADPKKLKYWMPVDLYNGGMEHTTLHLLYSRFWHKFLYDLKMVPTAEPYASRRSHGIVLAEDGRKMSKSFGNVINPDEMVKIYGADALRIYEMFMGPFDQAINWNTNGLVGCFRFLNRVWELFANKGKVGESTAEMTGRLHRLVKKVGEDLEEMKFNTAVSAFMEFVNYWSEPEQSLSKADAGIFLRILAPFAPHAAEELWRGFGNKSSVHSARWPEYDKKLIREEKFILIIQINGVLRDRIEVPIGIQEAEAKEIALGRERVKQYLAGKEVRKVIFVPDKLINFVV